MKYTLLTISGFKNNHAKQYSIGYYTSVVELLNSEEVIRPVVSASASVMTLLMRYMYAIHLQFLKCNLVKIRLIYHDNI